MNRDNSVIFEIASKYCILESFVDYDGYSISLKEHKDLKNSTRDSCPHTTTKSLLTPGLCVLGCFSHVQAALCYQLGVPQFNSVLTLPGDHVWSHRLRTQSTRHPYSQFRCQSKVQTGDFPGGPVVKTPPFNVGEHVWFLVGEHVTGCGQKLKKKKKVHVVTCISFLKKYLFTSLFGCIES